MRMSDLFPCLRLMICDDFRIFTWLCVGAHVEQLTLFGSSRFLVTGEVDMYSAQAAFSPNLEATSSIILR
jgi:hypothetical protein